jgi:hypothetical protein
MPVTLGVPESLVESLRAFVATENLPLTIVAGQAGEVRVVPGKQGQQSSATVLHAGGTIACHTAFEMAGRLDLAPRELGRLLDHLEVRVRHCQLGCFE